MHVAGAIGLKPAFAKLFFLQVTWGLAGMNHHVVWAAAGLLVELKAAS